MTASAYLYPPLLLCFSCLILCRVTAFVAGVAFPRKYNHPCHPRWLICFLFPRRRKKESSKEKRLEARKNRGKTARRSLRGVKSHVPQIVISFRPLRSRHALRLLATLAPACFSRFFRTPLVTRSSRRFFRGFRRSWRRSENRMSPPQLTGERVPRRRGCPPKADGGGLLRLSLV